MASKITNDRKRSEMKEIMAVVLGEKGWKPAEVAAVIGVTASNISSWKMGKNMGTNSARNSLKTLPARSSPVARELMEKSVEIAQNNVNAFQKRLDKTVAGLDGFVTRETEGVAFHKDYHAKEIVRAHRRAQEAQERAEKGYSDYYLEKRSDGMTNYEWDIQYHTKVLNEANAQTSETILATAKEQQERTISWEKKELAKATKYLKSMEKILAKW